MGGIFGGKKNKVHSEPPDTSLRVQTSIQGRARTIGWGLNRLSGNMIWYGDFKATPSKSGGGKGSGKGGGGGGKGGASGSYNYSVSVAFGLCEGPITDVMTIFGNNSIDYLQPQIVSETVPKGTTVTSGSSTYNSTVFKGSTTQLPWSRFVTEYGNDTPAYRNLCYITMSPLNLGSSSALPNFTFEILWSTHSDIPAFGPDANPADVIYDFFTNPRYGVPGFPVECLGSLTNVRTFCRSTGMLVSPVIGDNTSANSWMNDFLKSLGIAARWSGGVLDFIPYSESVSSAYGYTYTPDMTPVYAITDADLLLPEGIAGDSPIVIHRKRQADMTNYMKVEYLDRINTYNPGVAEFKDEAAITVYRERPSDLRTAHHFCDQRAATSSCAIQLQREQVANTYSFFLGPKFILLDLMDLITITYAPMDLDNQPVRIIEIVENADRSLQITAEEVSGTVSAPRFGVQAPSGFQPNYNIDPGEINTPVIFEGPYQLSGMYDISIAVSGKDVVNYGGCRVYASFDNVTYEYVGDTNGSTKYGILTDALPSVSTDALGNPVVDSTNPVKVSLTVSTQALISHSAIDMNAFVTPCLIDKELISYQNANLTGAGQYTLTPIKRGGYGSKVTSHSVGAPFIQLDETLLTFPYDDTRVGTTIYVKLQPFNVYGGGSPELATLSPHIYTIVGPGVPHNVTGFAASLDPAIGVLLGWVSVIDNDLLGYEIRVGSSWTSGEVVVSDHKSNALKIGGINDTTATFWIKAKNLLGQYSVTAASTTVVVTASAAPSVTSNFSQNSYVLNWNDVKGTLNTATYEISHGSTYAGSTIVGNVTGTTFSAVAAWSGSRTFYVTPIDIVGNRGAYGSVTVIVQQPSTVTITSQTVDNNVLLFWNTSSSTLPISHYEVRKGAVYSAAMILGTVNGTFDTLFETSPGTFTYWVVGVDAAGNYGIPSSLAVAVSAPPNFKITGDTTSTFSGTKTNMVLEKGTLVGPVVDSHTFQQHFTVNGFTSPQTQITAGFPYYPQPTPTSGSYSEVIDYGVVLASSSINTTLTAQTVSGTVVITPMISVRKLPGDPWTDYPGVSTVFATQFQYVKITYTFTQTGDDHGLMRVTGLRVLLSIKLTDDAGTGNAVSTDSGGTSTTQGTYVAFNKAFVNVQNITVQPSVNGSSSSIFAVVNYDFSTSYPTSFRVQLYNTAGARVSGSFSWAAKGQVLS